MILYWVSFDNEIYIQHLTIFILDSIYIGSNILFINIKITLTATQTTTSYHIMFKITLWCNTTQRCYDLSLVNNQ